MLGYHVVDDWFATYKMLLNNPFEHFWRAIAVPGAFRVDQRDGAIHANLQAIRFAAINAVLSG